jgi:hypothetical protein
LAVISISGNEATAESGPDKDKETIMKATTLAMAIAFTLMASTGSTFAAAKGGGGDNQPQAQAQDRGQSSGGTDADRCANRTGYPKSSGTCGEAR